LTSTSRIASIVPVASALIRRLPRTTSTVSTVETASSASPCWQALIVRAIKPRTANRSMIFVIP